jgi:hypothetical protein
VRLRLLVLFVAAALFTGVGTTTASAVRCTYDAPASARVDAHAGGAAGVSAALLGEAREGSAARPFEAGDASTTPNPARNATNAVPGGSHRAIVIGEDMEGRVIPKARELGADYYDPPVAPRNQWMENNRQWINDRMDEGCTIYNCGPAPGRANYPNPTSPYYQMELDEIAKRNYPIIEVK